ncbi:peptidoglycan-associated lipoprotein [Pedobacter sp. UYP30]|uniref:OmpA family protein n=1 Tax=Pedobacter sp. UYP30 TaxID=1756400 RepID=UPI003394009F
MEKKIYQKVIRCLALFSAIVLLAGFGTAKAQYVIKEADAQFGLNSYQKAASLYEQAYRKKPTLHAAERAAESYAAQRDFRLAESWYAIASTMPEGDANNTLQYAKALQNNSKYAEAKEQYKKYAQLKNSVGSAEEKLFTSSCDSAMIWMRSPISVTIVNEKTLNSPQSDWAAVKELGITVFASDRTIVGADQQQKARPFFKFDRARKPNKNINLSTGNSYLRLYEQDGESDSILFFPMHEATEYHIGPASFTNDGLTMYFARSQTLKETTQRKIKKRQSKFDTLAVGIYTSSKDNSGKWSAPIPFKYNSNDGYSVGDPFIRSNGNQLYFSSNIPGGLGGMDLYLCTKTDAGEWSEPINLREVNSDGNDRSPNIGTDGALYFSSDGRIGMGGLDIYKSVQSGGKFGIPVNMHYPVNSPQDDFAFNMTTESDGFLSSNRIDGLGSDDIYRFSIKKAIALSLIGKVLNKKTNEPLSNVSITLSQTTGQVLKAETDDRGDFKLKLADSSEYRLLAEKTGYKSGGINLSTKGLDSSTVLTQNLYLDQIAINEPVKLDNIYYDFDKATIRPDAVKELDKLVKIMQDSPTIFVELGSHTDSRGSDAYNLKLSQRRADAAVQYIISRGINKNRIEAKGYGETKPVNGCVNGVKCSAADYQLNRRTEFKITKQ